MAEGFTVANWRKKLARLPTEGSFSIGRGNKVLAVADGVTRDPSLYLPNLKSLTGKLDWSLNYPRPSPARISADIFTETFQKVLRDYRANSITENSIEEAFEEANNRIKQWNAKNMPNPDYLLRDFAGCVASGTFINRGLAYIGFIANCGIAKFSATGELTYRTENQGPDKHDEKIWKDKRLEEIDWRNPKARKIVRRDYRNNSQEEHSFGALTGEEDAMKYVRTHIIGIDPGEHIIVYSDGLEETIISDEFSERLREGNVEGLKKLCERNVKTEGTLIHYQHPQNWKIYTPSPR